jgi:plasmid stability protein
MKNITVSVDEETYRRARIAAAKRDTSVSAIVRDILGQIASESSSFEKLAAREKMLRKKVKGFSGADRLPREMLYERKPQR